MKRRAKQIDEMGTFFVGCKIANLAERSRSAVVPRLMVDTGSEYTWVPANTLNDLGIKPEKMVRLITADGSMLEREAGFALLKVDKFVTTDEVVFARKGDLLLLGARALEGMNVRVDPQAKKLIDAGPSPAAPICGYESPKAAAAYKKRLEKAFVTAKERLPHA